MNINEFVKGIIIGIAKIIPGLSGAVLMISFNLYDRAIAAITNFFDHPKKNLFFLLNLGMGIIIGVVLFSKVIVVMLGIMMMNPSNVYTLKNNFWDSLVFFWAGLLEAVGTVLPGISSTALLMLIGVYHHYIGVLGSLFHLGYLGRNLYFLFPFSCGLFMGVILISILVRYLFQYYQEKTFAIILGISFASVITLLIQLLPKCTGIGSGIVSLLFMGIGYFITRSLEEKN